MIILPRAEQLKAARTVRAMVRSGVSRKQAMYRVSVPLRTGEFKCTIRTIYRWLKKFKIKLR